MKRNAFLPMWNSPSQKMTTSATLGLGKNCAHTSNDVDDKFIYDDQVRTQNFKLEGGQVLRKKKKKLQIGIHIVLTNYKYTKLLFLNTLRYNHLLTNKKIIIIMFFLILGWLEFLLSLKLEYS